MSRAEELVRGAVWNAIRISRWNVEDVKILTWLKQIPEAGFVFRAERRKVRCRMTNDRTLAPEIKHGLQQLFRSLLVEKAGHFMVARGSVL